MKKPFSRTHSCTKVQTLSVYHKCNMWKTSSLLAVKINKVEHFSTKATTQHDFRSGSKKHTKHKICALLTRTKPPQQNHSIKYHTLSFPNKVFCQNNKTLMIFLSGGKNIGKTALKNQLMDLLRHHVIRHDKVPNH